MNLLPSQLVECFKFQGNRLQAIEDIVINEKSVALSVNGKEWLTFMCTPTSLEALAVGFLFNERIIERYNDVANIHICEKKEHIDIWLKFSVEEPKNLKRTSGCTGGYTSVEKVNQIAKKFENINDSLSHESISELIQKLSDAQDVYRKTGGVHSSAISDGKEIVYVMEDVGRHNTLDKLAGQYLLDEAEIKSMVVLSTGRISSEMLQKSFRLGASILISRTAATSLSIQMAHELGITLIGYARGRRFTIYSHSDRISVGV